MDGGGEQRVLAVRLASGVAHVSMCFLEETILLLAVVRHARCDARIALRCVIPEIMDPTFSLVAGDVLWAMSFGEQLKVTDSWHLLCDD